MNQADVNALPPSEAVSSLTDEFCSGDAFSRRLLSTGSDHVHLSEGEFLFEQGHPGDSMYLLLQGRLSVRLQHSDGGESEIAVLERGASVGEMALLTGQPRTATVVALADAELLRCSRESYERLADEHPLELAGFVDTITHRLQGVQIATVLNHLFGELDPTALRDLQAQLEWVRLGHAKALFQQGDPSDAMYVLVSGRLSVVVILPDGSERVVGEVVPGESVGELGLLVDSPHAATVYAIRETNLVKLERPAFERLLNRYPQAMMQILRVIVKRQQAALRVSPAEPTRALTLALIPANDVVSLDRFAHRLADELAEFGSVLLLDSASLDAAYGKEGAAQSDPDHPVGLVLASWLSEQETRHSYILYVAEPTWSPWTQRCVRQADRLVSVGGAAGTPEPSLVETAIQAQRCSARAELVLLHPAHTTRPGGTAEWLAPRQVQAHHHVRIDDQSHFESLARKLTGRAIGLVLSGGGARSFVHAGVFRALEELGIPIDRIGGTSMGALMGAKFAVGWSYPEVFKIIEEYFAKRRTLFDYTLPVVSLMATKKVTRAIKEVFGETRIEDLWHPFFCVSSNLTRAESIVHRTGPLWKALRASIAIPGVYVPILHEGDVLVDGAIMNNFPADIMHDLCEGGTIIGVNVSPRQERVKTYEFGAGVSGWQVLRSRINPLEKRMQVPSIVGSISRAMEINSVNHLESHQRLADLLIQPDVRQFGILEFPSYEPIIDIGYREAREQLTTWLKEYDLGFQIRRQNDSSLLGLDKTLHDLASVVDSLSQDGIP